MLISTEILKTFILQEEEPEIPLIEPDEDPDDAELQDNDPEQEDDSGLDEDLEG